MPLQHSDRRSYIRRTRVFVDSDERLPESKSQFDFVVDLDNLYEKVAGIELVGYNVKRNVTVPFESTATDRGGSNIVDVYLDDSVLLNDPYRFSVTLPSDVRHMTLSVLVSELNNAFNTAMDAGGHATYNTGAGFSWAITGQLVFPDSCLFLMDYVIVSPNPDHFAVFEFASGPNSANSAGYALGFPANSDTADPISYMVGATTVTILTPNQSAPIRFPRYLDVRVREFPEHDPIARISLGKEVSEAQPGVHDLYPPRLLTDPVKRLERMHITITLADGKAPWEFDLQGLDLIFDLLLIAPENNIPAWVQQKLTL